MVLSVTGAFATHTTKLYNYYVCPQNWNVEGTSYISVHYFNELKYLGKVIEGPLEWSLIEENGQRIFKLPIGINNEIKNDLNQFACKLNIGDHYLFLLKSIIGGCEHENLQYRGNGPFTLSHRFFPTLGDMFAKHDNLILLSNPSDDIDLSGSANEYTIENQ